MTTPSVFNPAVRKVETPHGGAYETPDGIFPRVTSILGAVHKKGLDYWPASVERRATIQRAGELLAEWERFGGSRAEFESILASRLGHRLAFQHVVDEASLIGSEAHGLIERDLRGELGQDVGPEPRVSEPARIAFTAYQGWRRAVELRPLAVEETVWKLWHGYAGTLDLYAELVIDGRPTRAVIDWKTSARIYPEAALQNAAYVRAAIERGLARAPVDGLIVRLPKRAGDTRVEVKVIPWEEQAHLFEVFLAVKKVWEWVQFGVGRAA